MKFDCDLQVETLCFYLHFTCCNLILQMQPTCGHQTSQPTAPTPPPLPLYQTMCNQFGGISRISLPLFRQIKGRFSNFAFHRHRFNCRHYFLLLLLFHPPPSQLVVLSPKKSLTVRSYFGPLLHLFSFYFPFGIQHFPSASTDEKGNAAII